MQDKRGDEYWFEGGREREELGRLVMEFQAESDRGAAIIGGAYLEERLLRLFRSRFSWREKDAWELLRPGGALGNFYVRAKLAMVLGFVKVWTFDDLKRIQKIRNYFAHHMNVTTFSDEVVRSHCMKLGIVQHLAPLWEVLGLAKPTLVDEPRLAFLGSVAFASRDIDRETVDGSWKVSPWPPKR